MSDPRRKVSPQQMSSKFPGAPEAWAKQTDSDSADSDPYISGDGSLRATDVNGGTYTWEEPTWICHECGTTPEGKDPSLPCHFCNRGPGMSNENKIKESSAGGVAGFQIPMGIRKRKKKVDELLAKHGFSEGTALAFFSGKTDQEGEEIGARLDRDDPSLPEEMRNHAIRELIRNKVREVVRKKAGGGGYTLYAPNPGKKGGSKPVGNFPTKMGAKRAELARFPPKDPGKLKRLRKDIERVSKDPKKAAEREKTARKHQGTDKGFKKKAKRESVNEAGPFSPSTSMSLTQRSTTPTTPTSSSTATQINKDPKDFFVGLKAIPGGIKSQASKDYIKSHLADNDFKDNLLKTPTGKQAIGQLYSMVGDPNIKKSMDKGDQSAMFKPGQTKTIVQGAKKESIARHIDHMHRGILSKIVAQSLVESLFREEKTESEWDDYISKLSKQALAGDTKFQSLHKNISKKTEGILDDAFNSIRKEVGKNIKLKSFGVKHDSSTGQTYLAFSSSFDGVTVEPIYIHIDGGVPKIHVSGNAKAALSKVDPDDAKMFRAELVTVQERVLDEMDDLSKAIENRDKYLTKLENEVDSYVSGLAPLQVSLLKQLLVKKYRKIS